MTAVVGSSLAMAGAAMAQQPANPAPARPTAPMPQYTAADAAAVLNARIAALKTGDRDDARAGRSCGSRSRPPFATSPKSRSSAL